MRCSAALADGLTNRELADRLFISERTANRHLSNIFTKLGVRNRTAAARIGIEAGLTRAGHGADAPSRGNGASDRCPAGAPFPTVCRHDKHPHRSRTRRGFDASAVDSNRSTRPASRPRRRPTARQVDPDLVEAFAGRVITDFAGAAATAITLIGDRLGLFEAMTGAGTLTASELAARTGLQPRLVKEWLIRAGGLGLPDATIPAPADYELPLEHAMALSIAALARVRGRRRRGGRRSVRHPRAVWSRPSGPTAPCRIRQFPDDRHARHRAVLPHRIHPPAGRQLVPRRRRPGAQALRRCPGGGHRLRTRRGHPGDGRRLAVVGVHRFRPRRAIRHRGPITGGAGRRAGERRVPGGRRRRGRRRALRRRGLLRRPA